MAKTKRPSAPIPREIEDDVRRTLESIARQGWFARNGNLIGNPNDQRSVFAQRRNAVACLTMWQLALRSEEAVRLSWSEVDLKKGTTLVQGVKNGKLYKYAIPAPFLRLIQSWFDQCESLGIARPSGSVFCTSNGKPMSSPNQLQDFSRKCFIACGWPRGSSHSFRCSAAVAAAAKGGVEAAQYLLRHGQRSTTEHYLSKLDLTGFQLDLIRGNETQDESSPVAPDGEGYLLKFPGA